MGFVELQWTRASGSASASGAGVPKESVVKTAAYGNHDLVPLRALLRDSGKHQKSKL
jgi:hypothetical protein